MNRPLVSICMPVLNARPFLEARLASLTTQTCADWELIVCDSHSNDGSWEFLQAFKNDPRVRLYQVPRAGLYAGWNECLRRIGGRYFCFATADDTASPEFLARMTALLERHPDVDIGTCQFDPIDEQGRLVEPRPEYPSDFYGEWLQRPHRRAGELEFLVHMIRGGCWTSITSVMFRSDLLQKVGFFEEHGTPVVDQLWAAKTALHSDTVWIPDHLATWRRHDRQSSLHWSRSLAQRQVELTQRTLDECEPRLPARWLADPKWREKLMWGAWHFYRVRYGLSRDGLRHRPLQFAADLGWNLWHEPGYALRRLCRGFSWDASEYEESCACVRRLVQEWAAPWPPVPIE